MFADGGEGAGCVVERVSDCFFALWVRLLTWFLQRDQEYWAVSSIHISVGMMLTNNLRFSVVYTFLP